MSQIFLSPKRYGQQSNEVNADSLKLKNNKSSIQRKSTNLNPAKSLDWVILTLYEQQDDASTVPTTYAQRCYQRAVDYVKQSNWKLAVQELREAIKADANQSEYHALLGLVHLKQDFIGMAKVYVRQALKLNPEDPIALKCTTFMGMTPEKTTNPASVGKAVGIAALLGRFTANKNYPG